MEGPATRPPGRSLVFRAWADRLAGAPVRTLIAGLLGLVVLAWGLPSIRFETHAERFLGPDHPSRLRYEAFKRDYGLDTAIFVLLEAEDVFAPGFLARLDAFHADLEATLPHLHEVRSLASARLLSGRDDVLSVREVRKALPQNERESDRLAARLLETSAYPGHLFSHDRTLTVVAVSLEAFVDSGGATPEPLSALESGNVVARVETLAEQHWPEGGYHLAGNPVVNARLAAAFARDMLLFTVLALVAIAACLALLFRRASAVVLPLASVMISIAATLGLLGHLGVTLNVTIQILPPFLLAVGASAAIHLLVIAYRELDAGTPRVEAVARSVERAGPALVATSLTTALGLGSFAAATDLAPVTLLGTVAPVGVLATLIAVLVLIPASLVLLPIRARVGEPASAHQRLGRGLAGLGLRALRAPRLVAAAGLACFVGAGIAASRVDAENDALTYFPDGDPVRIATEIFDERLSGTMSMEVLVDAGVAGGVRQPEVVAALDEMARVLPAIPAIEGARIQRSLSFVDVLREIHHALTEGDPEQGALPSEARLIAQELLLFEATGAEDLERVVASDYSSARITLRAPWGSGRDYLALIPEVEAALEGLLPSGVSVSTTGLIVLFAEAVEAISHGFVLSYGTAVLMVTLVMIAFLRSLRAGLASMVPNVLPIAITLGVMGVFGIDLDLFTMLIGSIALGLAVDDTVHLSHAFRRGWEEHGDLERAVSEGLETTGSAILTSSVVLCLGFATFGFSSMSNLVAFGGLTALSIGLALLIDVVFLPPLFAWTRAQRGAETIGEPTATAHGPLSEAAPR